MSLWSHACLGENTLAGCKQAVDNGFTGIEVDVQYHDGQFYLDYDNWILSNETLEQLLNLIPEHVDLWIDLKTCDVDGINKLIGLVSDFPHRLIVEVYDQRLVLPLENARITVARLGSFNTVKAWDYIWHGVKSPCATWSLDTWCLNDTFFADGGDIVITDFKRPWHCDIYFPGRWSLFAFIIIMSLGFICCSVHFVHLWLRRHWRANKRREYLSCHLETSNLIDTIEFK